MKLSRSANYTPPIKKAANKKLFKKHEAEQERKLHTANKKKVANKKKQDNSKLCEFCIYRVSFLNWNPLKVSAYIKNCSE